MTEAREEGWQPLEVALRAPGGTWKRRVVKTERAFERLLERAGDCVEVRVRPVEGEV